MTAPNYCLSIKLSQKRRVISHTFLHITEVFQAERILDFQFNILHSQAISEEYNTINTSDAHENL